MAVAVMLNAQNQSKNLSQTKKIMTAQSVSFPKLFNARNSELPDSLMNFTWNGSDWDTSDIEVYQYDANGNMISLIRRYFDYFTGQFINSYKNEKVYDQNGLILQETNYYWDSLKWMPSDRQTYRYVNGLRQFSSYEYYDNNQWVFSYGDSSVYTFNADKLPLTIINLSYDGMDMKWTPSQKMEISYGADKKPSAVVIYEWNNKWQQQARLGSLKWELGFEWENARPTAYVMQIFMLNKWVNYERYSARVNDGLMTVDSFYTWNSTINKWVDSVYTTYTYENGLLTERFQWQYRWDKKAWDTLEIEVHGYDNRGNEGFYQSGSKWGDWFEFWSSVRKTYTYSQSGRILEIVYENFDFYNNEWTFSNKVKYFYTSSSGILSAWPVSPTVFPNPASDKIFISGNGVYQMFDLKGQLLGQGNLKEGTNQIDISALPEGPFMLKINTEDGGSKVIKILKY